LRYKFEKTLGEGAFGIVKVASLLSDSSRKFAIKSIPRNLIDACCGEGTNDLSESDMNEEKM
jgi:hypothetical protein